MPASSEKQREAMAIAEHYPTKLFKRNREMTKMSKGQLHDFAKKPTPSGNHILDAMAKVSKSKK